MAKIFMTPNSGETPEDERRSNEYLVEYWTDLRGERRFPDEDQIDPDALEGLWEKCFLIQIRDIEQVVDYNFTYLGPGLIHAYDEEELPGPIEGMVSTEASHLARQFQQVIATRDMLRVYGEHRVSPELSLRFRQCLLPFGKTDEKVEAILGRSSFRYYEVKPG